MDMRFIRKTGSNWRIDKVINHKKYYFGTYPTLSDAMIMRDYFEHKGWENCLNERLEHGNKAEYITGDSERGFELRKIIDGECIHFGLFHSLEEAKKEREKAKKCNWDLELLCELDETNGNPQYLTKKLNNAGVWL